VKKMLNTLSKEIAGFLWITIRLVVALFALAAMGIGGVIIYMYITMLIWPH